MPNDRAILTDDFKEAPFWWEAAPPTREGAEALPDHADVVVVGGGYSGLSAALELARHGTSVVVLEAEDFGHGASSRNGGQVSGLNVGKGPSGPGRSAIEKDGGAVRMRELLSAAAESVVCVEELIEREKIDCCYVRCGRFIGAYAAGHYEQLAHKAELYNAGGDAGAERLPRARQREEIGTDFYFGGLKVARSGLLHPALLVRGLLDACRRHGVGLCSGVRMTGLAQDGGGIVVTTSAGTVTAREVVVGTNAETGPENAWLRRRLIPVASYIIATEPLPPDLAASLIPNGRGISDTKRIINYYRLSPDGRRVLFGGRARLVPGALAGSAQILYGQMLAIFPQLAGTRISHAWTGGVAFTFDHLPHMGRRGGVHYIAGCNGSGVAMMNYLGTETARKILGRANRPCLFDTDQFPTKPFYTGTPWFLPFAASWYALRDRLDRGGSGG